MPYSPSMNIAQVQGIRAVHAAYLSVPTVVITKTGREGAYLYEVQRGGVLVGITCTLAGARELAGLS